MRPTMTTRTKTVAMTAAICIAALMSPARAYERDTWNDVGCQLLGDAVQSPCWSGDLDAHAQGNVYNDKVHVEFHFTEAERGLLIGRGRRACRTSPARCQVAAFSRGRK